MNNDKLKQMNNDKFLSIPFLRVIISNLNLSRVSRLIFNEFKPADFNLGRYLDNTIPFVVIPIVFSPSSWCSLSEYIDIWIYIYIIK